MAPRTPRWTLLRLANLTGVAAKVAYEARDRQVLHPDVLEPSDALPLMTFDALRRISWPAETRGRAAPQAVRLWESIAIEQSRLALDSVDPATGIYVHPQGAELAVKPSEHVLAVLRLVEDQVPHHYVPLGAYAAQTLYRLTQAEDSAPEALAVDFV